MNPACVCLPHNAGLCSLINNVITCLGMYEYVHVDWSHPRCLYGDCWSRLFHSNAHPSNLGLSYDVIDEFPVHTITGPGVRELYEREDQSWRQEYHQHWRKLALQADVMERVLDFMAVMPKEFIATQIRTEAHSCEQASGKAQTKDQYKAAIEKEMGVLDESLLYVAASDEVALNWFMSAGFYPYTRRSKDRQTDLHLHSPQTAEDAINALVEVLIMSRARTLIHPVSNMATLALIVNPEMKSVYLP